MKSGAWSRWISRLAPVVASLGFGLSMSVPAAAQSTVLFCVSDASIVRVEFAPGGSNVYLNDLYLPAGPNPDRSTPGPFVTRVGNVVMDYELVRQGAGWALRTTSVRLPGGVASATVGPCRSVTAVDAMPRIPPSAREPVAEPPTAQDPAATVVPWITLAFEDIGNPTLLAAIASGDVAAGEQLAMQCAGCHSLGDGGPNMFGPNLYGVVYRGVGTHEGFRYSAALAALGEQGAVWTYTGLDTFLTNPQAAIPGNTMPFGGIADATERSDLIAFLRSLAAEPRIAGESLSERAIDTTMLLGDWAPDAAACTQGIVMTVANNSIGGTALGDAQCIIDSRLRERNSVTVGATCSSPTTAFRPVTLTLRATVVGEALPSTMIVLQQGEGLAEAATVPIDLTRCAPAPTP